MLVRWAWLLLGAATTFSVSTAGVDAGDPTSPRDPARAGTATAPSRGKSRADIGAYGGPGSAVLLQQPDQ